MTPLLLLALSLLPIDDFEDLDLQSAPGLSWMALGDWLLGGQSTGDVSVLRLPAGEASRGALRLTGHLGPEHAYAGAWTALRGDGLPFDLAGFRGLRFRVRGTPGHYLAGVRRRDKATQANLMKEITVTAGWSEQEIAFADLAPVPPSPVAYAPDGVAWLGFSTAADSPRDFQLDLDDVELVPAEGAAIWAVQKVRPGDAHSLDKLAWKTIAADPRGDGVSPRLPDARELQIGADGDGRVWFRFVLDAAPPDGFIGMNVALDVDGDPANGGAWWGQNKAFHFDRLVTAYLNRGAGYWQGVAGVATAADAAAGRLTSLSSDVRVVLDGARKTVAVGVPRAALGLPRGGRVRLIATVGSSFTFNDDVPAAGALDVTIPGVSD